MAPRLGSHRFNRHLTPPSFFLFLLQIGQMRSDVHCFGHTHINTDTTCGNRYVREGEEGGSGEREGGGGGGGGRGWEKPPIRLTFNLPMFTATGMRVRYLKVFEKSGYQPVKWVRYVTTGGDYEIRMAGH